MKHPRLIHTHDARNGVVEREYIINTLKRQVFNDLDSNKELPWSCRMSGKTLIMGIREGKEITIFECDSYIQFNYKS